MRIPFFYFTPSKSIFLWLKNGQNCHEVSHGISGGCSAISSLFAFYTIEIGLQIADITVR